MRKVFNNRGMAYVKTAMVILVIAMLFSLVLSYAFIMTTVSRVRDDTQRVLDSFCIDKSREIYESIKNGNNDMTSDIYTTEFMSRLVAELGLTRSGENAYHERGGNVIFRYTNPLTANLDSDTLSLTTEFDVVIPVSFADRELFELRIPLKVSSVLVLK